MLVWALGLVSTVLVWAVVAAVCAAVVVVVWGLSEHIYCSIKESLRYRRAQRERRRLPAGSVRRVAVVGAGSSGIAAAAEMIAAGFEVDVFEQTDRIGGNWVFDPEEGHASVYRSTFINTSKQLMSFSTFPLPEHLPTYPHHQQIVQYFQAYSDAKGVTPRIRFNTQVVSVVPVGAGDATRWEVTTRGSDGTPMYLAPPPPAAGDDNDSATETYDAVVVSNGHHSVPRWPKEFPGQDGFKGHLIHSHSYKDELTGFNYRDKRVVVVGVGNSGVDISVEVARVARQVYQVARSGAVVWPKFIKGKPLDHALGVNRIGEMLLPHAVKQRIIPGALRRVIDRYQGPMKMWGLDPGSGVDAVSMHPTVSSLLLPAIGNGTIVVKPQIERFVGDSSLLFSDGSRVDDIDAVIFATGYRISFPFLSDAVLPVGEHNEVELYKLMFAPGVPPTLSIIGLCQPLGALFPIAELQARWVAQLLLGNCGLPGEAKQTAEIAKRLEMIRAQYLDRPRHSIQVSFSEYCDEIAAEIGCQPSLLRNLDVLGPLLFSPVFPPQYRLNGVGAEPETAKAMLRRFHREVKATTASGAEAGSW